ncbi:30S ribosomal protein S13 [Candidatus Woesearchaeota archaeon]|nr:30S ribosomal protein S13 [Candidatus Woesearchaeota archaeon]
MADLKTDANFRHLVRIANVDLPGAKSIRLALTHIKGVGINFADALCKVAGVDQRAKTGYLSLDEVARLEKILNNPGASGFPEWMLNRRKDFETNETKHLITGTLTFVRDNDIKRLKKIKNLKGMRHSLGLPVRGQKTKAHFRKNKGKVVGVVKKKVTPGAAGGDKKDDKKSGGDKKPDKKK